MYETNPTDPSIAPAGNRQSGENKPAALEQLQMQQKLIFGLEQCKNILLSDQHYYQKISKALSVLGDAAEVDRVYIFENLRNPQSGEFVVSQRFEWSKDVYETQIDNPLLQYASYENLGMQRWYKLLSQNRSINGPISEFPESERAFLQQQDIVSLIVVPVIQKNTLWGFVGFDDCRNERHWAKFEESVLRVIASAFVSSISSQRQVLATAIQADLLTKVLHQTNDSVITTDENGHIQIINPAAEQLTGFDKDEATGAPLRNIIELLEARTQRPYSISILEFIRRGRIARTPSSLVLKSKTGELIAVQCTFSLLQGPDHLRNGALLVLRPAVQHENTSQ